LIPARPETGPLAFAEDWTGVFIRGDNAAYYAQCLAQVLARNEDAIEHMNVEALLSLLMGSREVGGRPLDTQQLRPFRECLPYVQPKVEGG